MSRPELVRGGLLPGAIGGLAGGVVFGAAMIELGLLPSVASIVRVESPVVGFIVHMTIAAIIGSGLGVMVWHLRPGTGETLLWGLVYGTVWWFIGTLTLHPLFRGLGVSWSAEVAQGAFPALLGHVLYGSTSGLAIVLIKSRGQRRAEAASLDVGAVIRGALAGLLAAWTLGAILSAQGQLHTVVAGRPDDERTYLWILTLMVGILAGAGFAALYPRPPDSTGAGIIRGAMYGFLVWVAVPLSLLPELQGAGLPWSAGQVRDVFPAMPGYLLFGGALGLFYGWLCIVVRLFLSDVLAGGDQEGAGTMGLRAVSHGVAAGVVGGLVFAGVMVQTGALTKVASIMGMTTPTSGFLVHMTIAVIVGSSYALLFRGQSYDVGSALGWGASYGFVWWLLGPLTLMPVFLGTTPVWTADAAAQVFPNLIGHLGYGAGVGISLHLLEARFTPWWVPQWRAHAARVERRREQVLTSAPALWTLVVVISLTLPVLLGLPGGTLDATAPVY